jgi:hypothetical protein
LTPFEIGASILEQSFAATPTPKPPEQNNPNRHENGPFEPHPVRSDAGGGEQYDREQSDQNLQSPIVSNKGRFVGHAGS